MRTAWTYFYNAFQLGGPLNRPTGFDFDPTNHEEVYLGEGYYGYELKSPKGKTIIVESTTGAIIGNSIEDVTNDICGAVLAGQQDVMKQQIIKASWENVRTISEEEFWAKYDRTK